MKFKKFFILSLCALFCLFNLTACTQKDIAKDYKQELNLTESVENFLNPDRGFYRTAVLKMTKEGVEDKSYIIKNDFQLYHLRIDISAFSSSAGGSDSELTSESLFSLEQRIKVFEDAGKNVILRFAYDSNFDGNINFEPSKEIMLRHIEQVCPVINKFEGAITAVEVGMVGPWGEMHTSELANKEVINSLMDKFLTCTTTASILVRTPQMIYDYLGLTIDSLSSFTYSSSEKYSRLGFFNDGFLGSESDLGTYSDREKEIAFLNNFTSFNPFGGEVTRPSCTLNDLSTSMIEEMKSLNLTYLNYEWNDEIVQNKWLTQKYNSLIGSDKAFYDKTAYHYIACNMGYRIKLTNSTFSYSDKFDTLKVTLDFENTGFGNLTKNKSCFIILVQNESVIHSENAGTFLQNGRVQKQTSISSYSGEVKAYLQIAGKLSTGENGYFVRLSNTDYDSTLNANYIGKININKKN